MVTGPLISIIIPCFNQAMYLREALDSVVAQTYRNLEVIIVNDGSTDGSEEQIKSIYGHYLQQLNIKAFSIPNSGVAVARNVAISQSTGEFFVPLDADDALHPEFVEKTLAVMLTTPNISFVYTNYELFGDVKDCVEAGEYEYWRYLYDKNLCASTSLIKKQAWIEAGGYNPNMIWGFEDWEFWISCGAKGHFGKKLASTLFFYRKKIEVSTRNTGANENSKKLFARMALNHPQMYPTKRVNWATEEWANAIKEILKSSDRSGLRYLHNLTADALEKEVSILRQRQYLNELIALYMSWLKNTNQDQKTLIEFNLAVEYEEAGKTELALKHFKNCAKTVQYQVPVELALRRMGKLTN
jgi:glycosyltransferase involved in cell wall biosynthesis